MMVLAVEMMIPMKSSSMTVAMATISPLREGISLADFSLPESFSLYVVSAPEAATEYFFEASPMIFMS